MKHVIMAAVLAVASAGTAFAQNAPAAPPTFTPAQRQQMQQDHAKLRQMHEQFRQQVLAAITPAHRALLAQVAGSLATSANPNYRAAAARLDAALSSSEKARIMSLASNMHSQMRSMMSSMPHRSGTMHPMNGMRRDHQHHTPTAGEILLMLSGGHGMMMPMMHP